MSGWKVFPAHLIVIKFLMTEALPVSDNKGGLAISDSKGGLPVSDSKEALPVSVGGKEVEKEVKAFSLSAEFRNFIGGMLRCVCYVHGKGYAMQDLSEENICIVDDELRYWKVNFVQTSMEMENQNFSCIANIISTILAHPRNEGYECPPDMTNLLNLLKSNSAAVNKKKIMRHMAMVSPAMRLMLVDEMFQMGLCKDTASSWNEAAGLFFVAAKLNDWEVNYKKKIIGLVRKCYDFRDALNPYITKVDEKLYVKDVHVVGSFLGFLRNIAHHGGEDEKKGTRSCKEAIDAILFWTFGEEIMLFIECMEQFELASDFWGDEV